MYVNQVGGQDELVFDGSSFAVTGDGGLSQDSTLSVRVSPSQTWIVLAKRSWHASIVCLKSTTLSCWEPAPRHEERFHHVVGFQVG